ncbi:Tfp pilus assembly protein FimT/FimU [Halobacteriovorax sp. HLS]|uniref:pilus assembly FimT family protein n=1 Tax=Halobacteriovorax sp. HLS TaxID=2234000 RepID=UPI000FDA0F39|nr:prepilin-type N-terminal cleavage/methylation domain-containing protein [Halobacteriovorax sp. HLS]
MNKTITSNDRGFTLIEMLVALLLVTIVLTVVTGTSFSTRRNLDEALNDIERGIRFSADEAALRNAMIRINFNLDEDPQKWSVEFGPDGNFVLPASKKTLVQSREEEDEEKSKKKALDKKFSSVKEFEDGQKDIPPGVRIIGIGTTLNQAMVLNGENALYIYPTGEKDSAIIVVATDDELASITVSPFTIDLKRKYYSIDLESEGDITDKQVEMAEEIYQEWLKE